MEIECGKDEYGVWVCGEDGDSVWGKCIWCVGNVEDGDSVGRMNMVCGVLRMEIVCGKDEYDVWGGWR